MMSRRVFTKAIASLLGAAALACRNDSHATGAPAQAPQDAPPDAPWTPRVPRVALGAGGVAHLSATRLRRFAAADGGVIGELPLEAGVALTALADGSLLVLDRSAGGLVLHHLGPEGAAESLPPSAWGGLLPSRPDALYPDPADAQRFRVASDAFGTVSQVPLKLVAGMLAPEALVPLERTQTGPLLAAADGRMVFVEGGAIVAQSLGRDRGRVEHDWEPRHIVRLAQAGAPDELWVACLDGRVDRVRLDQPARSLRSLRWDRRIDDLDADAAGLAILDLAVPTDRAPVRRLGLLDLQGRTLHTQELAGWRGTPSVVLAGEVAIVSDEHRYVGYQRATGKPIYEG